jgi:hypothetical protein
MARFVLLLIILFVAFIAAVTLVTGTMRKLFGGVGKTRNAGNANNSTTVIHKTERGEVLQGEAAVTSKSTNKSADANHHKNSKS